MLARGLVPTANLCHDQFLVGKAACVQQPVRAFHKALLGQHHILPGPTAHLYSYFVKVEPMLHRVIVGFTDQITPTVHC